MLPRPGLDISRISPPKSRDSSRLMARPKPVPPYLRLVEPSACWNASKMICCLSDGMPMPVSETAMASTSDARFRSSFSGFHPDRADSTARFDFFQDLSLPFYAGPVKLAPYGLLDLTYYTEDLEGKERGRFYGAGGVRKNAPPSRSGIAKQH